MTFEEYEKNLVTAGALRAEVKRRAMIFDCIEKERIAVEMGFKYDKFHGLYFKPWIKLKQLWQDDEAEKAQSFVKKLRKGRHF